jgi:small subunit ribosomal protein S17e
VKRIAAELMTRFPNKFSSNFDENKRLVNALTRGTTPKVRNQIAGYITRAYALARGTSSVESLEDDLKVD